MIDTVKLYAQLQAFGITDPLFHASNIHKCPVEVFKRVYRQMIYQEKDRANMLSISVSKIGVGLSSGKVSLESMLPFPFLEEFEGDKKDEITVETSKLFMELVRSGDIPPHLVGCFGTWLPRMLVLAKC
jgi:hypothetical protein